jgi:adenylate kinase
MRVIAVGCEYAGKTTLLEGLMKWGASRGVHHHLDDHFSIPDRQFLAPEDRDAMLRLSPVLKERFQRFQVAYHVRLINRYEDILLGGFHIEEDIYGPRYYYPGRTPGHPFTIYEGEMPADTILVLLAARPEVLERRMREAPHEYPIVPREDLPAVLDLFEKAYRDSGLRHRVRIDTSDLAPEGLLQKFLEASLPHLTARDMLRRMAGLSPSA